MIRDLACSIGLSRWFAIVVAIASAFLLEWVPSYHRDEVIARGRLTIDLAGRAVVLLEESDPRDVPPGSAAPSDASMAATVAKAAVDPLASPAAVYDVKVIEPTHRYGFPVAGPRWRQPVQLWLRRADGGESSVWGRPSTSLEPTVVGAISERAMLDGDQSLVIAMARAKAICDQTRRDRRFGRRRAWDRQYQASILNGIVICAAILVVQTVVLHRCGWNRD